MLEISQIRQKTKNSTQKEFQQPNDESLVQVYLRLSNKQTLKTNFPQSLNISELYEKVEKSLKIKKNEMILFIKGDKYERNEENEQKVLILNFRDIIHVHQNKKIHKNQLNLNFQPFQCSGIQMQPFIVQVRPQDIIEDTVSEIFVENQDLVLIQSGRKLDVTKTYEQQLVEDQSTIIITSFVQKQTNIEEFSPIKKIMQLKDDPVSSITPEIKPEIKEPERENSPHNPMLKKIVSWNEPENQKVGGFKKKQKPSKDVIWESDSSSQTAQKNLALKLAKKKIKQEDTTPEKKNQFFYHKESLVSSGSQDDFRSEGRVETVFTAQDRNQLQNSLKKLLFSENLGDSRKPNKIQNLKESVNTLQPPTIVSMDDFLEDVQQYEDFDINGNNFSHQQPEQDQSQLKAPINLKQSIGKNRGIFIPMVPTRDLCVEDDDQDEQDDI